VTFERATVCLPVKDRAAAHAFYSALGFPAVGEPGDDGLPEPLQFEVAAGLRIMLIPAVGFGWVIGRRRRAPRNASECMIVVGLPTDGEVDDLVRRAGDTGGEVVYEAADQTWGPAGAQARTPDAYAGAFTDPDGHLWHITRDDGVLYA
jgi:predicted lactoylglutathione lyase